MASDKGSKFLQDALERYKQRSVQLKRREEELSHRLELIETAMPNALSSNVNTSKHFQFPSKLKTESNLCNCFSENSTFDEQNTKENSRQNWADDSCSCFSEVPSAKILSKGEKDDSCSCSFETTESRKEGVEKSIEDSCSCYSYFDSRLATTAEEFPSRCAGVAKGFVR